MNRPALAALVFALAAAARAAEPTPGAAEPESRPRLVISHDKTPFMYGKEKIGELAEGTVAEVIETHDEWAKVRVAFGANWVDGWIRMALTVPDSLARVKVTIGTARRLHVYENHTLPGMQFLEVRVRFEADEKSPRRVYFRWDDEKSADLYLSYGRDKRILPYGFMRRKPLSARRVFERVEKRQVLLLPVGAKLVNTYVFAIPIRARNFDLVLKDVVQAIKERR